MDDQIATDPDLLADLKEGRDALDAVRCAEVAEQVDRQPTPRLEQA